MAESDYVLRSKSIPEYKHEEKGSLAAYIRCGKPPSRELTWSLRVFLYSTKVHFVCMLTEEGRM